MIPKTKLPAVERGLDHAFGVKEFDDITLLTSGLTTAIKFRIVVRGSPYLLRVIVSTDPLSDPTRQFACMKTAAEAGIAPQIRYANIEDRIVITDFVEAAPFPDDFLFRLAPTIRRLHSLPSFPEGKDYFETIHGFIRRFQEAKVVPASETEELFRSYADLTKVYRRRPDDMVASHNDLKPENILFDGNRVWLVDWETAFLNDRYADLAVTANFFVQDDVHEERYLSAYFGEPADDYRRSCFCLMSQAVHIFYATCFILLAAKTGVPFDSEKTPGFRDFHQRIVSGQVDLSTAETKLQYGKVHLNEALRKMRSERFKEALALIASTP